jgi:hypothetical protein
MPGTPSKPAGQLNRAALGGLGLKGLPLKPELLKTAKATTAAAAMDDSVEMKRKLEMVVDMPAVDMTMAEGEASVRDFELDDDGEDANDMDQALKNQTKHADSMAVDDENVNPLDAFLIEVKGEVKKVNAAVVCSWAETRKVRLSRLSEIMARPMRVGLYDSASICRRPLGRSSTKIWLGPLFKCITRLTDVTQVN